VAGPADAARELRRRIGASPDETLELPRDEVVHQLAPPSVNGDDPEETARYAQALLLLHGVRARPRLSDAGAVRTTLHLDRGLALQGAVVVAFLALVVGAVGRPLYGLLLGAAGALGVALVAWRFDWLDQRAPRIVPRGRTLGALAAGLPVVVMGLAVVLPIRESRRDDGDRAKAESLLQGARQSLAAGDVNTADDRVQQALRADPTDPQIAILRDQLVVARVQNLLAEQNRKAGVFDEAERAFRRGDVARAIKLMASIPGYRNADARLAAYKRAQAAK
jgi:hypothetical protein